LRLPEYKVKELFDKYGVPTMRGCVVDGARDIAGTIQAAGLSYPVVIKAQVPVGGRGKAGGIRFADSPEEAVAHCESLIGSELKGYPVREALIVERNAHSTEWYLSILLDRAGKRPVVIFSSLGGMEIEQTAASSPDRIKKVEIDPLIGVQDYAARYLLSASGLPLTYATALDDLIRRLYRLFTEYDALLVEINPLVLDDAEHLVALDGKMEVDDSALYRLPDMAAYRDGMKEEDFVKEARAFGFLYIPVEKGGTVAVCSNGSGMLMSCIDMITKNGMAVGAALDLGGGATAERIAEAMRILFATPGIRAVVINIFGGITRCDEVAGGVKLAMEKGALTGKLIVLRMEGTNKEQGIRCVESLNAEDVIMAAGLRESIQALVERRDRL
jgi:succinyl-CoA synthetase beta subunit